MYIQISRRKQIARRDKVCKNVCQRKKIVYKFQRTRTKKHILLLKTNHLEKKPEQSIPGKYTFKRKYGTTFSLLQKKTPVLFSSPLSSYSSLLIHSDQLLRFMKFCFLEETPKNTSFIVSILEGTDEYLHLHSSIIYAFYLFKNLDIINTIFLFRHHVPFVLYILLLLNNLFVVFNSSVNFIVYCCVSKSFRNRTLCMIRSKLSAKDNSFL